MKAILFGAAAAFAFGMAASFSAEAQFIAPYPTVIAVPPPEPYFAPQKPAPKPAQPARAAPPPQGASPPELEPLLPRADADLLTPARGAATLSEMRARRPVGGDQRARIAGTFGAARAALWGADAC